MYVIRDNTARSTRGFVNVPSLQLWYEKVSEVHEIGLLEMSQRRKALDPPASSASSDQKCSFPVDSKTSNAASLQNMISTRATSLLELVQTDAWGPIEHPSVSGTNYSTLFY